MSAIYRWYNPMDDLLGTLALPWHFLCLVFLQCDELVILLIFYPLVPSCWMFRVPFKMFIKPHQPLSVLFLFIVFDFGKEISMPCVAEISILWPSYYASCKSGDWKGVWLVILLHAYGVDSVFPIELVFQDMFYSLWYCFFLAFCPYSCIKVLVAGLYFICPSNRSTP